MVNDLPRDDDGKLAVLLYRRIPPQQLHIEVTIYGHDEDMGSDDEFISFAFYSQLSVNNLKERIDQEFGLSPHRQRLVFMEREVHGTALLDQLITDSIVLTVSLSEIPKNPVRTFTVTVEFGNSNYRDFFTMERQDNIHNLRGSMRRKGYVRGTFTLFVRGRNQEHLPGSRTFEELHIDSNSVIYVEEEEDSESSLND